MSFFGWFKSAPQSPKSPLLAPARDARPGDPKDAAARAAEADIAERRKNERARLRELLYKVVRESMVRVGVLSSSFKFKVLATDPRGRKFIVMMDLSRDFGSEISQLAEIEKLICQSARARHNIVVSAVYWRAEAVAPSQQSGSVTDGEKYRATLPASAPTPAPTATSPAMAENVPAAAATARRPAFDPVLADEISALKKALAAGSAPTTAAAQTPRKLTGYEITEIIESELPDTQIHETEIAETEILDDEAPYPALSPTQYGELR